MEIKWHGNTCFSIKNKNSKLVINPDKQAGTLSGDVVLSSLGEETAEVKDAKKVFDWPGEYEINDISIDGFPAWTKGKASEEAEGKEGDETIVFYFEIETIRICHLGGLGHVLTSETVKELGDVDILLIDLGEKSNLDLKKTIDVIESIEPRIVIPMGEGDFSKALKELGDGKAAPEDKFTIKIRSELPDDKRLNVIPKKV